MGFLLALILAVPTALVLATGSSGRTATADIGASFTLVAIVLTMIAGIQELRFRRGERRRPLVWVLALLAATIPVFFEDRAWLHNGISRTLTGVMDEGAFMVRSFQHFAVEAVVIGAIVVLVAFVCRKLASFRRNNSTSPYVDAPTLREGAWVAATSVLLIPWIALAALMSLEGPRLIQPWTNHIGAMGTAGLAFSSSLPLIAPGALLLGLAFDRALGWRWTMWRRRVGQACVVALVLAPVAWPWLAAIRLRFPLMPGAWGDVVVDDFDGLALPLLCGGAVMVALAFLIAASAVLATRRGPAPMPSPVAIVLSALVFFAVRLLVPRFGPEAVPIVAIVAMLPPGIRAASSVIGRRSIAIAP